MSFIGKVDYSQRRYDGIVGDKDTFSSMDPIVS
jgi:hypothetical protein